MSIMRLEELPLFRSRLEESDPAVVARGGDEFAVRGEGCGVDGSRVALEGLEEFAVIGSPEFDGVVGVASRG